MATGGEVVSRVQFAYQPGGPYPSHCGYCHSPVDSFMTEGVWAEEMKAQDFQDLVDRGFQRSGKFVYLPSNKTTCCPQYVMRLDSTNFRISKQQKRVIRRFKEYLETGFVSGMPDPASNEDGSTIVTEQEVQGTELKELVPNSKDHNVSEHDEKSSISESSSTPKVKSLNKIVKPGQGADPNKPPCRKAKLIRQEKKAAKNRKNHLPTKAEEVMDRHTAHIPSPSPVPMEVRTPQKQPTDMAQEIAIPDHKDLKHKFTVKLVRVNPREEEFDKTKQQSYEVFRKFQMVIHKEPEDKCQMEHFMQFCVESPLFPEKTSLSSGQKYGSYHQQYWIDNTLLMVGVLDYLPQGVLCNYLYYDPYYRFLAPGVFSALYEISQTQALSREDPQMKFYYMGYYVHDCPKMNYKRFYDSSYILCPETYQYVPLPLCKVKLDNSKYCQLSDTTPTEEKSKSGEQVTSSEKDKAKKDDLSQVQVANFPYNEVMKYKEFEQHKGDYLYDLVLQYTRTVGPELANRMVLFFTGLVPRTPS